jgi:hypothetical protein
MVARRIGYSVISFEPDPQTYDISKEFFMKNDVEFTDYENSGITLDRLSCRRDELILVRAAVSDFDGYTHFTRILDNPTANHLSGRKNIIYGETNEQTVRTMNILNFKSNAIIKIDAEGEDYAILKALLTSDDFNGLVYLCDWRDETRKDIFDCLKVNALTCYNPFLGKHLVSMSDLPLSKSCDFLEVRIA